MKDRKKYILDGARIQFLQYGFKKTSLDDIVQHLSISKGLIYTYFKNKEDLFRAVAEAEYQVILNHIRSSIASAADPQKRLLLYVINRIDYVRDYFSRHGGNLSIYKELKNAYRMTDPDNSLEEVDIVKEILEQGEQAAVFREKDNEQRAALISLLIEQFELTWIEMPQVAAQAEIADLFALLFEGICTNP